MSRRSGVSNRTLKAVEDLLGITFRTAMKEGRDLFGNFTTYYSTTASTHDGRRLSVALPDGRRLSEVARKSWRAAEKELADAVSTPGATIFQPIPEEGRSDVWVLPGFSSATELRMKAHIHGGNFLATSEKPKDVQLE